MKRKSYEDEPDLNEGNSIQESGVEPDNFLEEDNESDWRIIKSSPSPHVLRWILGNHNGVFYYVFLKRLIFITAFMIFGCGILLLMETFQTTKEMGQIVRKPWIFCPDTFTTILCGATFILTFPLAIIAIEKRQTKLIWVVLALTAVSGFSLIVSSILIQRRSGHLLILNTQGKTAFNQRIISKIERHFGCCYVKENPVVERLSSTCCWKSGTHHRRGGSENCERSTMAGQVLPFGCTVPIQRFMRATAFSTLSSMAYCICISALFASYCGVFIYLLRHSASTV